MSIVWEVALDEGTESGERVVLFCMKTKRDFTYDSRSDISDIVSWI